MRGWRSFCKTAGASPGRKSHEACGVESLLELRKGGALAERNGGGGLALADYSWCRYVFEQSEPGEYICRIEMLEYWPGNPRSVRYIRFLEENGVQHVATHSPWVYFRRKSAGGAFDIYSDYDSRIRHYQRVAWWWLALVIVEFFAAAVNLSMGISFWRNRLHASPFNANVVMGCMLLALGIALLLLSIRFWRKAARLKRERALRE